MNQRVVCLPSSTMENILLWEDTVIPTGELHLTDDIDLSQLKTIILGLQLKFGISKRHLPEQPIPLDQMNITVPSYSLSMQAFAFE